MYLPHFLIESMFIFGKKHISKYKKFAFSDEMNLRIIAKLLKNAPVLLKRLELCFQSLWHVIPVFYFFLVTTVGLKQQT